MALSLAAVLVSTTALAQRGVPGRPGTGVPGGDDNNNPEPTRVMAGIWALQTTCEKVTGPGLKAEDFSATLALTFLPERDRKTKIAITGQVFGNAIVESDVDDAEAGKRVSFSTTYEAGGKKVTIKWRGKLSKDGRFIEDGKFTGTAVSGTFTGSKS
jgi:hypothetical protein